MYMSRCGHNAMTTTTQNFSRKEITLSQQSRECIIIGKNFFQIDLTIKLIKYSHHTTTKDNHFSVKWKYKCEAFRQDVSDLFGQKI